MTVLAAQEAVPVVVKRLQALFGYAIVSMPVLTQQCILPLTAEEFTCIPPETPQPPP